MQAPFWIYFLLGFFLCAGRIVEAFSLYSFGFLVPLFAGRSHPPEYPSLIRKLALAFILLFWIFPLHNLIGLISDFSGTLQLTEESIRWKSFLKSKFGSALFLSGLFLWITTLRFRTLSAENLAERDQGSLKPFYLGLGLGSLVLLVFALVQFFTGYHYVEGAAYRPDRVLAGSFYRSSGFFAHPMTLASLSLTITSFCLGTLFAGKGFFGKGFGGKSLADKEHANKGTFGHETSRQEKYLLGAIAGMHSFLVLLSGSRAACLVLIGLLFVSILLGSKWSISRKIGISLSLAVVAGALIWASGLADRFMELAERGLLGDRKVFWQAYTHLFLDSPLFGQGSYQIKYGLLEETYSKLGYGDFARKYNAHNLYLETLASCGILGLILIGICLKKIHLYLAKLLSTHNPAGFNGLLFAFLSQLIFGLVQNTLFLSPPLLCLLTLMVVLIGNRWTVGHPSNQLPQQ